MTRTGRPCITRVTDTDSSVSLESLLLDSPAVWTWAIYLTFLYLIFSSVNGDQELPHKVKGIPPTKVQRPGTGFLLDELLFLYPDSPGGQECHCPQVPSPPLLDLNSDMKKFIPFSLQPVCTGSLPSQLKETEQTRPSKFENKPTGGCGSCDILGF